jgi:D-glycero-alpha-D-manno-heptose-7-phosphate kinase
MIIESIASNRIGDFGGWTDTWFAEKGAVLNFAVNLYARVTIRTRKKRGVTIYVQDYGEKVEIPDPESATYEHAHAMLIAAVKIMKIRQGIDLLITADVPPGCGTGSSAAIAVAMIKALGVLNGEYLSAHQVAQMAHRIDTEELGVQSGVQDQIGSAYGGVNFIEIADYPTSFVSPVEMAADTVAALENRWLLVYEGKGHLSHDVHMNVISDLKKPRSRTKASLGTLRKSAHDAKRALMRGDLEALAETMNMNNEAQKSLHPAITTDNFERIEAIGRKNGMIGAMINGAGGGGSTLLLTRPGRRFDVAEGLAKEGFQILPCVINPQPARAWVSK